MHRTHAPPLMLRRMLTRFHTCSSNSRAQSHGSCVCADAWLVVPVRGWDRIGLSWSNVHQFFVLAHFSQFVPPGSIVVAATSSQPSVHAVAFETSHGNSPSPSASALPITISTTGTLVAVLFNADATHNATVAVQWEGQQAIVTCPPNSLLTLTWPWD